MEKEIHNCPTCGAKCTVGGEGLTHYYIPTNKPMVHDCQFTADNNGRNRPVLSLILLG